MLGSRANGGSVLAKALESKTPMQFVIERACAEICDHHGVASVEYEPFPVWVTVVSGHPESEVCSGRFFRVLPESHADLEAHGLMVFADKNTGVCEHMGHLIE